MIKILHLSDFHYKSKNDEDFKSIVIKLRDAIDTNIDVIVFSGDLLYQDDSYIEYLKVANMLFDPILQVTNLSKKNILIVPGNHDINLNGEIKMVNDSLISKNTVHELDEFCESKEQIELSIKRFNNFNEFIKLYYGADFKQEALYITSEITLRGHRIGLVGLNSAWRCIESTKDRGHLIYPVSFVRKAFDSVKNSELILCAMHHNISDFKDFVAQDIEDIINENCHLLFTGHYHKSGLTTTATSDVGLVHSIAPATYNRNDKTSQYGYSILEIDELTFDIQETPYFYQDGTFLPSKTRCLTIPMCQTKKEINDFRRIIRRKINEAEIKADDLFVYGRSKEDGQTFETLFKEPIIKDKSLQEILTSKRDGNRILLKDIVKNKETAIIFGHDKCGKTSLLFKLLIDSLKNYSKNNILPIFLEYDKIHKKQNWKLIDDIRNYYEKSKRSADDLIQKFTILILIDDLDFNDGNFIKLFQSQMAEIENLYFIACSEETMSGQCALINFKDEDIAKYYIHDITPKEVHQLTISWPNIIKERKRDIEAKIVKIFTQMHIPFNYWTTSLFLWILEKTDEANIHNNFELINLYIDEILDKKGFVLNTSISIIYDDLKSYLAALAEFVITNSYEISDTELFNFTETYRQVNKKFTISSLDAIKLLNDKTLIVKNNNKFTFRLKGVFEYFLAYRMKENKDFKDSVLANKPYFFSFGNELELYAGFQRDDTETVKSVFNIIKELMSPLTSTDGYNEVDSKIDSKLQLCEKDVMLTGKLIDRISTLDYDNEDFIPNRPTFSIDESKVVPKIAMNDTSITSSLIEKSLFIISRVYRNSNVCNAQDLSQEILNFVLTGTCNLGFMIIDDAKSIVSIDNDDAKSLIKMVSNYMPVIIEAFLYDALSQRNLVRVMEEKLEELKKDSKGNEFRIFLLSLILVDLDVKNNLHYIIDSLEYIKKKTLRFAVINKMAILSLNYSDQPTIVSSAMVIINGLKKEFKDFQRFNEKIETQLIQKKAKDIIQKINIEVNI